jgi:hypothetical protein
MALTEEKERNTNSDKAGMVGKCWGKMESWKDVWEGFIMTRPL